VRNIGPQVALLTKYAAREMKKEIPVVQRVVPSVAMTAAPQTTRILTGTD